VVGGIAAENCMNCPVCAGLGYRCDPAPYRDAAEADARREGEAMPPPVSMGYDEMVRRLSAGVGASVADRDALVERAAVALWVGLGLGDPALRPDSYQAFTYTVAVCIDRALHAILEWIDAGSPELTEGANRMVWNVARYAVADAYKAGPEWDVPPRVRALMGATVYGRRLCLQREAASRMKWAQGFVRGAGD